MEILVEALVWFVVDGCCTAVGAAIADIFASVAGYNTYKTRSEARKRGEAPPETGWSKAFRILLPIAILLTLIAAGMLIWRLTR
jgi:hypothetical protein